MSAATVPPEALVVLPTFNEAANLRTVVSRILEHDVSVLVVDDASPDGTGIIADGLAADHRDRVRVLHRPKKEGLGPAYAAGFEEGMRRGVDILIEMDADLSHDPDDLPKLVASVESGAGLVIGSRYVPGGATLGWSPLRKLLSVAGNVYARLMLGTKVRDMTSGYRAFSSPALAQLSPATCHAAGYAFQVEMAWRAERSGVGVVEIPIVFRERESGLSKMDWKITLEAMVLVTWWGLARMLRRHPSIPRPV